MNWWLMKVDNVLLSKFWLHPRLILNMPSSIPKTVSRKKDLKFEKWKLFAFRDEPAVAGHGPGEAEFVVLVVGDDFGLRVRLLEAGAPSTAGLQWSLTLGATASSSPSSRAIALSGSNWVNIAAVLGRKSVRKYFLHRYLLSHFLNLYFFHIKKESDILEWQTQYKVNNLLKI